MQFFTPYGLWSYIGVLISGLILGFIGRQVAKIGTAFEDQFLQLLYLIPCENITSLNLTHCAL
jgi:uncharacterized membrane protein YkvI